MLLHLQANLSILRPSQKSLVAAESSTSQILLLIVFHALNLFALKLSKSREAKEGGCELNLKKGELQCHGSREGKKKAFMEKTRKVFLVVFIRKKEKNFFETSIGVSERRSQERKRPPLLSEMPFRVTYSSMHRDAFIARRVKVSVPYCSEFMLSVEPIFLVI